MGLKLNTLRLRRFLCPFFTSHIFSLIPPTYHITLQVLQPGHVLTKVNPDYYNPAAATMLWLAATYHNALPRQTSLPHQTLALRGVDPISRTTLVDQDSRHLLLRSIAETRRLKLDLARASAAYQTEAAQQRTENARVRNEHEHLLLLLRNGVVPTCPPLPGVEAQHVILAPLPIMPPTIPPLN